MKNIFIGFAIAATGLIACNSNTDTTTKADHEMGDHSMTDKDMGHHMDSAGTDSHNMGMAENKSVNNILTAYLNVKNALAKDDAKEAASAGTAVVTAVNQVNETALTADQKKIYAEVKADMVEHGNHIAENAGKIAHQREHFEILSKDMYDLVKVFGSDKTMYYTNCPMYNNNKGANWLSEVKEISNPYLGKEMLTCGTVKEELK